jgi:NDP-sugar pyrophosphorylase family protein
VNYKREIIEDYFGDGTNFGVEIEYLHERQALGTAGALSLLPADTEGPLLIINGDIVTNSDFTSLFDYHRKHLSVATVAAVEYRVQVPLGVLSLTDHHVLGIEEKPEIRLLCNAGIYVLSAEAIRFVPSDRMYHMTDLINDLVVEGLPVGAYPLFEQWTSIERPADLEAVNKTQAEHGSLDERTQA